MMTADLILPFRVSLMQDDEMAKMMQVLPLIQDIQKDVMTKYGFTSAMEAMQAMQEHASDPEIARFAQKEQCCFF